RDIEELQCDGKALLRIPALGIQCLQPASIPGTGYKYGELDLRVEHQSAWQHAAQRPTGHEVLLLIVDQADYAWVHGLALPSHDGSQCYLPRRITLLVRVLLVVSMAGGCVAAEKRVDFNRDVRPIL